MKKLSLHTCYLLIGTALVFALDPHLASAGERFAVQPSAQIDMLAASPSMTVVHLHKLAPELRTAVTADAAFVGVTESGESVLEFPDEVSLSQAEAILSSRVDHSRSLRGGDQVRDVDKILVFTEDSTIQSRAAALGLELVDANTVGAYVVLQSKTSFDPEVLKRLAESDGVTYIEPNFPYSLDQTLAASAPPDDPHYQNGELWGMTDAGLPAAWRSVTSAKVIVAVIDSGVDYTHPDLESNIWTNPGEVPGNGVDDDRNGYVDDIHGYDFFDDDGDPMDMHSHGSHCAGTIAAIGNNGQGVVGVAWQGQIMALRIFGPRGEFAGADQVVHAIDYATAMGAKVMSNSWGGRFFSAAVKGAIDRAQQEGILFVAAAGNSSVDNDRFPHYPSSYGNPNVVSVASIDESQALSSFSNVGLLSVDLAAPGSTILSTVPGSDYQPKSGTSMATPHVSGALALVWSDPRNDGKSWQEIRDLVLNNVRKLPGLRGKIQTEGTLDLRFTAPTLIGEQAGGAADAEQPRKESVPGTSGQASPPSGDLPIKTLSGKLHYPAQVSKDGAIQAMLLTEDGSIELDFAGVDTLVPLLKRLDGEQINVRGVFTEAADTIGGKLQPLAR